MKKQFLKTACAAFLIVGMAGTALAQIHIRIGPPPPRREVIPAPPPEHRGWVWHPGYNRYECNHYVWVPGAYAEPPHAHARWVPGHWTHRRGEYFWVEGHWR